MKKIQDLNEIRKDLIDQLIQYIEKNPGMDYITSKKKFIKIIDSAIKEDQGLSSLKEGIKIIKKVIKKNGKIKFILDSDADGLGTAYLTHRFFNEIFPYDNKELIITDRKKGYGFIPDYINGDEDLFVTADNGITSIPATKIAKEKGAKVIITDHHQPDPELGLPQADAVIDPFVPNDKFPYKHISGTFVYFIFLYHLAKEYELDKNGIDLYEEFLPELVLTTLSDVMPLNDPINRFVIKDFFGIPFELSEDILSVDKDKMKIKYHHRPYINTFLNEVNSDPVPSDFSFTLIPAINATNRMATAEHGFYFMIAGNENNSSSQWLNYIFGLNESRKTQQAELLSYIEKYYKDWINPNDPDGFIIIPGKFKSQYKGVLGIIAGKLAEKYSKPTMVLNLRNGIYEGSGRSVNNYDVLNILRKPDVKKYINTLGGHKQAFGISVKEENLNDFFVASQKAVKDIIKENPDAFKKKVKAKYYLSINDADHMGMDLYNGLFQFEPFGHMFWKPNFQTDCFIKGSRVIGKEKNHLSLTLTDKNKIISIKGLWFFYDNNINIEQNKEYSIIWQPEKDDFNCKPGDEKLSFRIMGIYEKEK